jgi:hypothetical protein
MINIIYRPKEADLAIADGNVDYWVNQVISHKDVDGKEFWISTGLCIDALRVAVKQRKLDHDNVRILYENNDIRIDKNGTLDNWPNGFNDKLDTYLNQLLGLIQ